MIELSVGKNEAGQRADKLLFKYLNAAPASFVYKMMRKKNIVLNGKKMTGKEILTAGDRICIWLSEETLGKFHISYGQSVPGQGKWEPEALKPEMVPGKGNNADAADSWFKHAVLYEDNQIILVNKPANVLSQRADGKELSMNEYLIAYLLAEGKMTERELDTFHPAFCNRLDRNTTGILAGGKTLAALQSLSELFRTRRIEKYYLAVVCGGGMKNMDLRGYLHKDAKTNKVEISPEPGDLPGGSEKKWERVETAIRVLNEFSLSFPGKNPRSFTLLKIHLITGKTHQIRAHLASVGHPVVGDAKYGRNRAREKDAVAALLYFESNAAERKEADPQQTNNREDRTGGNLAYQGQMLHSYELDFPEDLDGPLRTLAGRQFICDLPACGFLRGESYGKDTSFYEKERH